MNASFFLRQIDIADPAKFKNKPITVYDFDTVWECNSPIQLLPMFAAASEDSRFEEAR